jgi:hypothetical protein
VGSGSSSQAHAAANALARAAAEAAPLIRPAVARSARAADALARWIFEAEADRQVSFLRAAVRAVRLVGFEARAVGRAPALGRALAAVAGGGSGSGMMPASLRLSAEEALREVNEKAAVAKRQGFLGGMEEEEGEEDQDEVGAGAAGGKAPLSSSAAAGAAARNGAGPMDVDMARPGSASGGRAGLAAARPHAAPPPDRAAAAAAAAAARLAKRQRQHRLAEAVRLKIRAMREASTEAAAARGRALLPTTQTQQPAAGAAAAAAAPPPPTTAANKQDQPPPPPSSNNKRPAQAPLTADEIARRRTALQALSRQRGPSSAAPAPVPPTWARLSARQRGVALAGGPLALTSEQMMAAGAHAGVVAAAVQAYNGAVELYKRMRPKRAADEAERGALAAMAALSGAGGGGGGGQARDAEPAAAPPASSWPRGGPRLLPPPEEPVALADSTEARRWADDPALRAWVAAVTTGAAGGGCGGAAAASAAPTTVDERGAAQTSAAALGPVPWFPLDEAEDNDQRLKLWRSGVVLPAHVPGVPRGGQ